jgi:type IV fimbrial biogenesis protein FimT
MATQANLPAGGFTLIELMVTLGIGAIMLALGAPSFVETINRYKLDAAHTNMRDALLLARDTARNETALITLCASSSGTACTNSTWDTGVLLFRDEDGDGSKGDDETVVAAYDAAATAVSIAATVKTSGLTYSRTYIQFSAAGELDPSYALNFTSCAPRQTPYTITVQRGGFISTTRGSTECE